MKKKWNGFRFVNSMAVLLAFFVIALGAYTRLTDAGLGCPDWPGCYGHWVVPEAHQLPAEEAELLRNTGTKAWTEMIHRYAAGSLGLLILIMTLWSFKRKKYRILMLFTLATVVFQAYLGMATVTLKLHPLVVMGHLLGGILTLLLLFSMRISQTELPYIAPNPLREDNMKIFSYLGVPLLLIQIGLGGWTSTNYAGLVCPSFPACNAQGASIDYQWREAFRIPDFSRPTDFLNKSFEARVTIQMVHRYGALFIGLWLLYLSMILAQHAYASMKITGLFMGIFLIAQVVLGAINAIFALPLHAALLHNNIAVLLLMTVLFTAQRLWKGR